MRFQMGTKTSLGLSVCMVPVPRGFVQGFVAMLQCDRLVYLAEEISRRYIQVLAG